MDRYIPTGSSAKGGLGEVVFCTDQNLDRNVVIKYGNQHHRLLDELAALQRIRSKHVVEIFDVVYDRGDTRMGIVEEFIDGEELSSKLGNIKSGDEFVHLIYQLSSGLADIHAVGIVHRDIKPSNVLVDTDRILKIIDFNWWMMHILPVLSAPVGTLRRSCTLADTPHLTPKLTCMPWVSRLWSLSAESHTWLAAKETTETR